ncbi:MAG: c-type cytochrome biogenesis protein CcsB [Erysipelotrichaceae bacterium]|nr:c-type cytochrome biogenesis protein CcsB [Erysipelotrichaceae bacterium]
MLDYIFFGGIVLYFVSMILMFIATVFHKEGLRKIAWYIFMGGTALETVYLVYRGILAGRLPLSNQFEFATAFSWGISVILVYLHYRFNLQWVESFGIAMTFLIISYAALQPRQITELMPALRSAWFGLHIGTAAFSYACFVLAGAAGLRYITEVKNNDEDKLEEIDYFIYRLVCVGLLLLTVTIVSGAIWAEEAWGAFWTWDPKEVWALITWILYALYLHLRVNKNKKGLFSAWFVVLAVPVVLFTFIGVNTLLPGLHSYGSVK